MVRQHDTQESRMRVQRDVANRWTAALVEGGWTPVSDYFLENYHRLEPPLSNAEAMFIIHLMRHKWDQAAPYPGFKIIAKRMGVSITAARGYARRLETKGYIKRKKRTGTTNRFFLDSLFASLEALRAADNTEANTEPE